MNTTEQINDYADGLKAGGFTRQDLVAMDMRYGHDYKALPLAELVGWHIKHTAQVAKLTARADALRYEREHPRPGSLPTVNKISREEAEINCQVAILAEVLRYLTILIRCQRNPDFAVKCGR